jgi:hypothetical protein
MLPLILRVTFVIGLLGALWIVTPVPAFARPYNIDPGPGESGDPTADDHPSPTPKPKARAVTITASQGTNHGVSLGRTTIVRVPWEVYRRLLTQYWAR